MDRNLDNGNKGPDLGKIDSINRETVAKYRFRRKSLRRYLLGGFGNENLGNVHVPDVINSFLDKMNLKAHSMVDLSDDFNNVAVTSIRFNAFLNDKVKDVYITSINELNEHIMGSFAYDANAYTNPGSNNRHYSSYCIFLTNNVLEEDIPKLIKGNILSRTDKLMIYDISKNILYGSNNVNTKNLKKELLAKVGVLEDINLKYFKLTLHSKNNLDSDIVIANEKSLNSSSIHNVEGFNSDGHFGNGEKNSIDELKIDNNSNNSFEPKMGEYSSSLQRNNSYNNKKQADNKDKKSTLFIVGIIGGLLAFLPALYGLFFSITSRPDLLVPYIIGTTSSALASISIFFIEENPRLVGVILCILAIVIILECLIGSLGAIILLILGIILTTKK
jgi:hypothetical protein